MEAYIKPLDISSKEAYLAWVEAWKVAYSRISDEIRTARHLFKNVARGNVTHKLSSWQLQWKCQELQTIATRMLEERRLGKVCSWAARNKALASRV